MDSTKKQVTLSKLNQHANFKDDDGQPLNHNFHGVANKTKAIFNLKGILQGVVADSQLNQHELLFLENWLKNQGSMQDDGDVVDLLDLISDILEDKVITEDELIELNLLINDVVNYCGVESVDEKDQVNEFLGLLSGIAADDLVNEIEVNALVTWLNNNENIIDVWPVYDIYDKLSVIIKKDFLTEKDSTELLAFIKKLTGTDFLSTGAAEANSSELFDTNVESIKYRNYTTFCFTGKFSCGTRRDLEEQVKEKGSKKTKDVSGSVDYLVVGALASRDWICTSHGRKIEAAHALQKKGHRIAIISEEQWIKMS